MNLITSGHTFDGLLVYFERIDGKSAYFGQFKAFFGEITLKFNACNVFNL